MMVMWGRRWWRWYKDAGKRPQAALLSDHFAAHVGDVQDAVLWVTSDGTILHCTASCTSVLGYPPDVLTAKAEMDSFTKASPRFLPVSPAESPNNSSQPSPRNGDRFS